MTLYFSNTEITIYRTRRKGSSNRYGLSATFTSYQADIQPLSLERTQYTDGRFGATYDAFVDATVEIKEGDQIVDSDGKRYSVKAVTTWHNAGMLDHKELVLVSIDG